MLDAVPPTPPALTSAAAAADVVRSYYRAVSRHDYGRAYGLWNNHRSYAAFVAGYRHTRSVTLKLIPPFDVEGAAGSSYATIPVRVDARLDDGRLQHFSGSYTLRRVNDVEGSTAAQRRWHIESAKLTELRR